MAEGLMRQMLERSGMGTIQVESAGVFAVDGMSPTRETQRVLQDVGVECAHHRARTVTLALTPEQVQLLALVQEKGSVYLSLRRFGDKAQPQLPVIDLSAIFGPQ
jgi:protein-tyrosine-phosphatase